MQKSVFTFFPRFPPAAVYFLGSCLSGSQSVGGSRSENTYSKVRSCPRTVIKFNPFETRKLFKELFRPLSSESLFHIAFQSNAPPLSGPVLSPATASRRGRSLSGEFRGSSKPYSNKRFNYYSSRELLLKQAVRKQTVPTKIPHCK